MTPTEQFDLDNYMKHYYSRQDHLETEDNGDFPQLLLLSIQRCHQYTERNNINNQEIKFSDTITVLRTNKTELQYTLPNINNRVVVLHDIFSLRRDLLHHNPGAVVRNIAIQTPNPLYHKPTSYLIMNKAKCAAKPLSACLL